MYDRHEIFQVTAPANTPSTAPVEVPTVFHAGEVQLVRIKIPRGHASLTGIQIAAAHQPVIPRTAGAWILGSSDLHDFHTRNMPESGQWSVFLYNTDNRAHYWQVIYFLVDRSTRVRVLPPRPTPVRLADVYAHNLDMGV